MKSYAVLLWAGVVQALPELNSMEVEQFWRFVAALETDPFQDGDFEDVLEDLPVKAKVLGGHSILFAADHPLREVKILRLLRSD